MKKITLLFVSASLALTSCSSNDDSASPVGGSDNVLVRKIVYQDDTDTFNQIIDYTYNGNKLVQGVADDGSVETYTYIGDLITQIQISEGTEVVYTETFAYDSNDRLIEYHAIEEGYDDAETFVYNADGTATSTLSSGGVRTLHFQNDELVQVVNTALGGATYNYSYDGKNSPFRNVTGYSKIVHVAHGDHEFFGRNQNITAIDDVTNGIDYMTNTLTYNADNYPTSVTSVAVFESEGTFTATVNYTY